MAAPLFFCVAVFWTWRAWAQVAEECAGWIEFLDQGVVICPRGKTDWREVEIGCGSSDVTCPVVALQTWLKLARIAHGPLFRRIARSSKDAGPDRLTDRHVARLVWGRERHQYRAPNLPPHLGPYRRRDARVCEWKLPALDLGQQVSGLMRRHVRCSLVIPTNTKKKRVKHLTKIRTNFAAQM
jgi:hypothetical protein